MEVDTVDKKRKAEDLPETTTTTTATNVENTSTPSASNGTNDAPTTNASSTATITTTESLPPPTPVIESTATNTSNAETTPTKAKKIARGATMAVTAKEGGDFLKEQGSSELLKAKGHGMETRGRKAARETLSSFMEEKTPKKEEKKPTPKGKGKGKAAATPSTPAFDEKAVRDALRLSFRLFDKERKGKINEEGLADVMRSLGKRPIKKKIRAIFEKADADKDGFMGEEEFINYMIQKKAAKLGITVETTPAKTTTSTPTTPSTPATSSSTSASVTTTPSTPATTTTTTTSTTTPSTPVTPVTPVTSASSSSAKGKGKGKGKGKEPEKPLARAASIADFYTSAAGLHDEIEPLKRDQFMNPEGSEYDLGKPGAFVGYKVLVYVGAYTALAVTKAPKAIESKGFKADFEKDIVEFVKKLKDADVAWIISGPSAEPSSSNISAQPIQDWSKISKEEFVKAVEEFHLSGRGVALFADDFPLTTEANAVLEKLGSGMKLVGNTPGGETLAVGKGNVAGQFARHLITSGMVKMYEGVTVCYPENDAVHDFEVLATSSNGHPLILYKDSPAGVIPPPGRLVVDCAFTKLWAHWQQAGSERYVLNLCVWLLGLEQRLALGLPLKGALTNEGVKYIWQYQHGGWYNFTDAASDLVEQEYQNFLKSDGNWDVRSVSSGYWTYMVDFRNMQQTNIQHANHTIRKIRRVPASLSLS